MSSQKTSQTLTQGKLNFGATKPKRTSTHNVKSQTRAIPTPKKIEETPEPVHINVSSSSSEEESTPKVAKQEVTESEKMLKKTQPEEFTTALRLKSSIDNSDAPNLNVKDRKYTSLHADVRKKMNFLQPIHSDGQNKIHEILRCFDMSYEFGPCVGVSRLERWERAHLLGLNPPKEVKDILTTKQGLEQEEYSQSVLLHQV